METFLLTCLQANLIIGRAIKTEMPLQTRKDLIWEIKNVSPKECKIDANAD